MELVTAIFVFFLASLGSPTTIPTQAARIPSTIIDVVEFGAKGDGKTDDSQVFLNVWKEACGSRASASTIRLPAGKVFLLKPTLFQGPCKPTSIILQIDGWIAAPSSMDAWKGYDIHNWIRFSYVDGLIVRGNGVIDGKGEIWYPVSREKVPVRPIALSFVNSKNLQLSGFKVINSPGAHISAVGCDNSVFSHLNLTAPGDSPNTDGIDVSHISNLQILNANIGTGDDCIAIGANSTYINITGVQCGPGHGISIGSLGKDPKDVNIVEQVNVKDCHFTGSTNGVRIKTWQGGSGYCRKITYDGVTFDAVENPIIIDQFYCDPLGKPSCPKQAQAIHISDITYNNLRGTSKTEEAVALNCSQSVGCTNITLNQINITSAIRGKPTHATCNNAHGRATSPSIPKIDCLSP